MHLTKLSSAKRSGFSRAPLHRRREVIIPAMTYLKHKSSFFVATLSLVAFVSGNMMGQHGWYAFWKSVFGATDDRMIVYVGAVPPIAMVPDYSRWSMYGGNAEQHTYRQVPKDMLVPLPVYDQKREKLGYKGADIGDVFSIGHMGSYATGAEGEGSHIGVDIRVPEGTPVRSVMNGVVSQVREDPGGFGKLIVIRHPNVPDPDEPKTATVLHSVYAHLSAQFVSEGDMVVKGQEIGLSGQTGFATGPHLHFQVERDEAPHHPYWVFSGTEARDAGLTFTQALNGGLHAERGYEYTVHPMLYVQASYPAPTKMIAKGGQSSSKDVRGRMETVTKKPVTGKSLTALRDSRLQERLARRKTEPAPVVMVQKPTIVAGESLPVAPAVVVIEPVFVEPLAAPAPVAEVAMVDIQHDRQYTGREWEKVRLTLLDSNGKKVSGDSLRIDLHLRTAYGEAEFEPKVLTSLDFKNGVAEVKMLPRGRRTVVILIEPLKSLSQPIQFNDE
jgi:hypothetical protein